jgi:hypothetical protein
MWGSCRAVNNFGWTAGEVVIDRIEIPHRSKPLT